jgi:hypothetical protein
MNDDGALVLYVCTSPVASTVSGTTTYSCSSAAWTPVYGLGGMSQTTFETTAGAIISVLLVAAAFRIAIRFFLNR